VFLGLGGAAGVCVLATLVTVFLAPDATPTILVAVVGILILVVAAEIVLWLVDRPRSG
jgi:hypothetical protein